jgi:hypothetical protein
MHCKICKLLIASKRYEAGYMSCFDCGDSQAKKEIEKRKQFIGLAYNKGPIMLLASTVEKAKGAMLDAGRKTRSTDTLQDIQTCGYYPSRNQKTKIPATVRKIIGTMWIDGQAYAVYNRDDPRLAKAQRKVFYS